MLEPIYEVIGKFADAYGHDAVGLVTVSLLLGFVAYDYVWKKLSFACVIGMILAILVVANYYVWRRDCFDIPTVDFEHTEVCRYRDLDTHEWGPLLPPESDQRAS